MSETIIDALNRTAKLFIDSGAATTVDEAMAMLGTFTMHLTIDAAAAESPTHQAALLTAINCGLRSLLGGVTVDGALDAPLAIAVTSGLTLGDAVLELGGAIAPCPPEAPLVVIGGEAKTAPAKFAIRTTCDGWRGGIVPLGDAGLTLRTEFTVSGAFAGALAVAEVFAHLNGEVMAGRRSVGLSLWQLDSDRNWLLPHDDEPMVIDLPSEFWVIGLGHLGQAYLWTIGLLPYAERSDVRLFLQDVDRAGKSTKSTSLLTRAYDERRLKTRICADWAEQRGFNTAIIERRFDTDFRRSAVEPGLALCGVDNPDARRILDEAGFAMVLEAGLGNGAEDFRLIRVHSFPAAKRSADIWPTTALADDKGDDSGRAERLKDQPAYIDLREKGDLDECGLTQLADVAVGAPFVGVTAAAVVVGQAVRAVSGGPRVIVANLDLRSVDYRSALTGPEADLITFATAKACTI